MWSPLPQEKLRSNNIGIEECDVQIVIFTILGKVKRYSLFKFRCKHHFCGCFHFGSHNTHRLKHTPHLRSYPTFGFLNYSVTPSLFGIKDVDFYHRSSFRPLWALNYMLTLRVIQRKIKISSSATLTEWPLKAPLSP